MRIRALAVLLALGGQVAGIGPAAAANGDALARERASAVIVWSHLGPHRDAMGAGVIVASFGDRLRILTARHVIDGGAISVWHGGYVYHADLVQTYPHRDLAVIDATVPAGESSSFASASMASAVKPGEAIDVWGEDDYGVKAEAGTIVTPHLPAIGDPAAPDVVGIVCEECQPGDSGAGVFDPDGNLVAILSARYRTPDGRTVVVVAEPVDATLLAFR